MSFLKNILEKEAKEAEEAKIIKAEEAKKAAEEKAIKDAEKAEAKAAALAAEEAIKAEAEAAHEQLKKDALFTITNNYTTIYFTRQEITFHKKKGLLTKELINKYNLNDLTNYTIIKDKIDYTKDNMDALAIGNQRKYHYHNDIIQIITNDYKTINITLDGDNNIKILKFLKDNNITEL
ncbi:MAG: hypothetical protein LBV53_01080 [Mycoplasmataceae bacterium]|jgi:hypothetical protein|nr:hypothetical protein [Mycoplasmataceae bacterium]